MGKENGTVQAQCDSLHLPTPVKIRDIQQDNYRTKTFVLDASFAADPGQFVMAWLPRFDEKPFSLVNADPITLMVTAVGPFSTLLHTKEPGDFLWIRGPFGQGFQLEPDQRNIALIGGGYGVAPLYWFARIHSDPTTSIATASLIASSITTIIGARTSDDILYAERFHTLQQSVDSSPQHSLLITTEDGTYGIAGRVTDALEPLLARQQIDGIFACGPHGMLAALRDTGRQHHIPYQLSWEAYMRCAIGICGACEFEGKVLCLDGPVLSTTPAAAKVSLG